ncbi:thiolase C-terminal domain-containing protein [Rhodococcoides kyotonense]|uniref:Acetyl-CoA acetyltransferase n=1 Tax=Rhodococcoides kyotonense TaxID=398843 RepID=A0A239F5C1_9NOCA|nr:thiolase [Rhodococcus kyotonensis]SNS52089.1 Acetyl-CoA acetyltransferase [Rhodococcus kyotonensis]
MSARVAIVGAAETDEIGTLPHRSTLGLHLEAARNALADCGLDPKDVDGIAGVSMPGPLSVAHSLGIEPRWMDTTSVGGTSFLTHVRHAVAALQAGQCSVVLITHGESGRSRVGAPGYAPDPASLPGQFEAPYGVTGPPSRFTLPFLRFMKETGTQARHLADVAVAQRTWAGMNPRAKFRDPISVDDVQNSPVIAWPFHLLECCLVTDGGGALVLTTIDRARDLDVPPVEILGTGEGYEGPGISMMEDFTSFKGFKNAGAAAFQEAGLSPSDIDHVMIYDAFAHLPLYGLEDLGFVGRGEAGEFVREGNTSPGGRLPVNTNGGGLSYTHTGMYGMFAIQESVRQLRGTAPAQVDGVRTSLVQGNGGMFAAGATLILGVA